MFKKKALLFILTTIFLVATLALPVSATDTVSGDLLDNIANTEFNVPPLTANDKGKLQSGESVTIESNHVQIGPNEEVWMEYTINPVITDNAGGYLRAPTIIDTQVVQNVMHSYGGQPFSIANHKIQVSFTNGQSTFLEALFLYATPDGN